MMHCLIISRARGHAERTSHLSELWCRIRPEASVAGILWSTVPSRVAPEAPAAHDGPHSGLGPRRDGAHSSEGGTMTLDPQRAAHQAVALAVINGTMKQPRVCEQCGQEGVTQAHH